MGRGGAASQPDTIRILAIAVHPSFQGHRYARALLQSAADIALSRGASALALTVHPENEHAVRTYVRDGWERVLEGGEWKGTMRKSLVKNPAKPPKVSIP